jgi:predicted AAA+ superfamily ATPase
MEIVKWRLNRGLRPELYFYRDTQGNEVDLLIREGRKLVPVEIKSASTFTEDFVRGNEHFRKTVGNRSSPGYVFYNGEKQFQFKGVRILNLFSHGVPDGFAADQGEGRHG